MRTSIQQTAPPHNPAVCTHCISSLADRQSPTRRLQTHLEEHVRYILGVQIPYITMVVAQPFEWHHLLGWPALLFEADSFKSRSKSDSDHLIKSHGLKLLPTGNQCCLSYTPISIPPSGANMPVTTGRMARSITKSTSVCDEGGWQGNSGVYTN